jgi:hypothetical protein
MTHLTVENHMRIRFLFTGLYLLLCTAAFLGINFLPFSIATVAPIEIHDFGKATLDLLTERNKLASTIITGTFSVAIALAVKGKDWSSAWGLFEGILVVLILVCGAAAYYGVLLSYTAQIEMVAAGAIGVQGGNLGTAWTIQYYCVLISVFLLGLLFTRLLEHRVG